MWTKAFWKGLGERAIKTFFQSGVAAAALMGAISGSTSIADVPWLAVLGIAALATVLSVATSIGNADFTSGAPAAILVGTASTVADTTPTGSTGGAVVGK